MNEELSLWELVLNASITVQAVMLLLFVASVVSWAMIVQRALLLAEAADRFRDFENQFWSGVDLNELYREGNARVESGEISGAESVFRSGFGEFLRLRKRSGVDSDAIMEGVQRAMRIALSRQEERLERHLPFLATVGSTSPYVGLFGTVWGIMHSFRGLANVHQATLASVAPGISEALIATAMGLFAAIPAVIAYNRFSARVDTLMSNYETFSDEFSSILHRQVHARDAAN